MFSLQFPPQGYLWCFPILVFILLLFSPLKTISFPCPPHPGLNQLPVRLMCQLKRLALSGGADASPLHNHLKHLKGLQDLVLDGCVGVEPILAALKDLQVRKKKIKCGMAGSAKQNVECL